MPYIDLNSKLPGLPGLMAYKKGLDSVFRPMAQFILVDTSPLTRDQRELVATLVSAKNGCNFCTWQHGATAAVLLNDNFELVNQVIDDYEAAPLEKSAMAMLRLAEQLNGGGGDQYCNSTSPRLGAGRYAAP